MTDRTEHIRYLHATAERYKDSVFMRAYVLLTASAAEAVVLSGLVAYMGGHRTSGAGIVLAAAGLTLTVQFVAAYCALDAVSPWRVGAVAELVRRRPAERGLDILSADEPRFSSFNRVAAVGKSQFVASLASADDGALYQDLVITYYNLCRVVSTRYLALRRAYIFQQMSLVLFAVTLLAALLVISRSS